MSELRRWKCETYRGCKAPLVNGIGAITASDLKKKVSLNITWKCYQTQIDGLHCTMI